MNNGKIVMEEMTPTENNPETTNLLGLGLGCGGICGGAGCATPSFGIGCGGNCGGGLCGILC